MRALSITNGAQLRARDKEFLIRHFGKTGAIFYNFARGVDDRPVEPSRMRKSVGCEETYRRKRHQGGSAGTTPPPCWRKNSRGGWPVPASGETPPYPEG